MCGIVAIYGEADEQLGRRMLRRLAHRGPDGEGEVRAGRAWLGHRRLAIVDVEGGRQPLHAARHGLWLVGNGEVYNHAAIRPSLEGPISTRSDNEVPLHLFAERGPEAFGELRGMYAFAIAGDDGSFVAARDPVGIKPLFWARRGQQVVFASELKAFDPDWQADAELFPPGHFWTPERGLVEFRAPVPAEPVEQLGPPDFPGQPAPEELRRKVRESVIAAVEREMMADVPVGVFLSGGLDSNLVAAIAARYAERQGKTLYSFAIGSPDSPDLAAARQVAKLLGTEHHERLVSREETHDLLEEVIRCIESYDPSLVASAIPNYLLSELAARHVKVALTGEGADEIFAGYEYLHALVDQDDLHDELVQTVRSLHGLNLQRADRVTMAHGLEARVPFLDLDLIELGLALPAEWKVTGPDGVEKRLLREAFEGWLPQDLLWRKKAQFGEGSGARAALKTHAEIDEESFSPEEEGLFAPRSAEEALYRRIYAKHYPAAVAERTMSRFATV